MNKRFLLKKTKVILRDNKSLLLFLFFWFLGGFLVYFYVIKLDFYEAVRASFFFKRIENDFSSAYGMWSQAIVFGVIFSFLMQNIFAKYNPERGCRMMAKELQDHIIVIGFSHFGERLVNHFKEKKITYCLIEKNRDKVDELLNQGEPVIIDDAKESDALVDANINRAKAVIIASNNLETALIVTKRARDCNKNCQIITRCFQDEFAEIIESLGASEVISSSKNAFEDTLKKVKI
jgi:hypothetical protein